MQVATQLLEDIWQYEKRETEAFLELMVHFLMRLEELHVPRDWTNDLNLYELVRIFAPSREWSLISSGHL